MGSSSLPPASSDCKAVVAQLCRGANRDAIRRLAGGLQIPTVGASGGDASGRDEADGAPFEAFIAYLQAAYPTVCRLLRMRRINTHSLLFHWEGKDPNRKPILFLSHYDVVPAPAMEPHSAEPVVFRPDDPPCGPVRETQVRWEYGPFSGAVANGRIYGRGALDMKGMLFSIMEAVGLLLGEGFQPEQGIWLAFGHDEETGGLQGAVKIAEHLQAQGLVFDAVFDEGGMIGLDGAVAPGVAAPLAVVGLGEKGYLTLGIRVRGTGGHSSMPPAHSSLVLASEIALLLHAHQMPSRLIPPVAAFFSTLTDIAAGGQARQRQAKDAAGALFDVSGSPAAEALIRTTTAITMMRGSDAPNVLAATAELVVNFRILQGDTIEGVIEHVRRLCKGYDTEITIRGSAREPSGLTPVDAHGCTVIRDAVAAICPGARTVPSLTVGGTDAYKYQPLSKDIFRFMPVQVNPYELQTVHSDNEHLSIENYGKMIAFFYLVMRSYEREAGCGFR